MKTDELVQYVESFCDVIENKFDYVFLTTCGYSDLHVSLPATLAALRVYFYIENKDRINTNYKQLYDVLYFILTDERVQWDSLTPKEKVALCVKTRVMTLFVLC